MQSRQLLSALKQLHEVKSVDAVMGPYDVIAILEAENITNIVAAKIKAIPGISRTVDMIKKRVDTIAEVSFGVTLNSKLNDEVKVILFAVESRSLGKSA